MVCFSSISHNELSPTEDSEGTIRRDFGYTQVAHPDMVASSSEDARPGTSGFAGDREDIISAQSLKRKTPTSPDTIPTHVPLIRKQLQNRGFS